MTDNIYGKFKPGTKVAQSFEILSDHNWHCAKHELPGTQTAGLIREIKNRGYDIEKKKIYCTVCQEENTHRRLIS